MCEAWLEFPGVEEGLLEQNPFCGGGMDIFWNYTLYVYQFTVIANSKDFRSTQPTQKEILLDISWLNIFLFLLPQTYMFTKNWQVSTNQGKFTSLNLKEDFGLHMPSNKLNVECYNCFSKTPKESSLQQSYFALY